MCASFSLPLFRQMVEFVSGKGTTFAAFCHIASTNEVAFVYSVAL
jgi:hypothetical protein